MAGTTRNIQFGGYQITATPFGKGKFIAVIRRDDQEHHRVEAPKATAALELARRWVAENRLPRDRKVIEEIVAGLFVNGSGERATRLVLVNDRSGRQLGGLCPEAVVARFCEAMGIS